MMSRLLDFYIPLCSFGLELDEKISQSRAEASVTEVQTRARTMLDGARTAALAAGKRPEQVELAAFAVVAWIDEIITRNPAYWGGSTPLQVALFNTNNAGNEFFHNLGNLKAGDDEVREVYYHMLLLGFVGQYYYETGDNGELGKLKELHQRQLPVAPAPTHVLREEQITPQPYLTKDPTGPRFPRQWDKLLLKIGLAVALLIPLGYLAWFFLTPEQDRGPTLQQLVDTQLATYACSDLSGTVSSDAVVNVSGYASTPDDVERVRRDVAAISGVKSVEFDVKLRIWPHCEVIALLKPYRQRNLDQRMGLEITPTTGHSDRFIEGERIIVKTTNANYDGYIYVDYWSVEGDVLHLFPHPEEAATGQRFQPNQEYNVGETARGWDVGPPFGQELITIVSSPVPLYEGEREAFEQAKTYLPALRAALESGDATIGANFMIMQTEPARATGGVQ